MKTERVHQKILNKGICKILIKKIDPKRSTLREGMINKETGIHVTLIVIIKK